MSKQQFLRLDGFTKTERIQMTSRVSDAINQSGAWITDFHLYSNISICINFQVASTDVKKLAQSLQETDLHLSPESIEQLVAVDDPAQNEKEWMGTLQITFVHNEPDLIREVPNVPG